MDQKPIPERPVGRPPMPPERRAWIEQLLRTTNLTHGQIAEKVTGVSASRVRQIHLELNKPAVQTGDPGDEA